MRRLIQRELPIEHLLPDREPAYVGSWVYVFGVITIAALVLVIGSGVVLSFFGPQWWQVSPQGHFFNSLHFWSVQMFFVFMVLHLWGQYFAQGWRDGRAATWMVGVVVFLMYGLHILLLPLALAGLVAFHIVLVRLRGVVRPPAEDAR